MPNWLFTVIMIATTALVIMQLPGYAILPLGVGIMYNGQYMVNRGRDKKNE